MQITSSVHPFAADRRDAARAERIADQHCCDNSTMKGIATVIAVIAIIIFGALLITEWPALLLPAALVTGIWAYDCLFKRSCCS